MKGEARIAPPISETCKSSSKGPWVGEDQRLANVVQRRLNETDEPVMKGPGREEAQCQ